MVMALALLVAGGGTYSCKRADSAPGKSAKNVEKKTMPGSYIAATSEDWTKPEAVASKLDAALATALPEPTPEKVKAFLAEPANRLMLAQRALLLADKPVAEQVAPTRAKAEAELKKINEEFAKLSEADKKTRAVEFEKRRGVQQAILDEVNTLADAAKDPKTLELMNMVCSNLDWLENIVNSGDLSRPGAVFALLQKIRREAAPNLPYDVMERDIATATAIEFVKSKWNADKAVIRADFYIRSWHDDRLNLIFDKIPFWQRRMVCGCKGDNGFGELPSLEWLQRNAHMPAGRYCGCQWRCGYKTYNPYGETVQGPGYNEPYTGMYTDNSAKFTYEVGGVCGSLSHFGAFGALANGIPALTAGEPGHCAFVVLVNGKWTPGYSVSWQRGLHWQPWREVHVFASLHDATDVYSPEQKNATALAHALRTLAGAAAENKDAAEARKLYREALKAQPLHFGIWRAYAEYLTATAPGDKAAWSELNKMVCNGLTPVYPELAAELLSRWVYPTMVKSGMSQDEVMKAYNLFWKKVTDFGPERWRIEQFCDAQVGAFKKGNKPDSDVLVRLYRETLGAVLRNEKYAPVILAWGNSKLVDGDAELQKKMMDAMVKAIGNSGDASPDTRDAIIGQALAGAEQMRDREAFCNLARNLSEKYKKPVGLPKVEPLPGKLLSQGGLFFASSTSQWDKVCEHPGLLNPRVGGSFHTGKQADVSSWCAVELPRTGFITGIQAVTTTGNHDRLRDLSVQVSETGKDDDWKEVGKLSPIKNCTMHLDISALRPQAKYIRIISNKKGDFLHLRAIMVYGEQAS